MEALQLINSSSYDPATIKLLGQAFDEVWLIIGDQFSPDSKADARIRLAHTILSVGRDGHDLEGLKALAIQVMSQQPL